jgi:hypothetical protein
LYIEVKYSKLLFDKKKILLNETLLYIYNINKQVNNNNTSPVLLAITANIDDLLACILVYQKLINKYEDIPTHSQPRNNCTILFEVTNIIIVKVNNDKYEKNLIL